MSVHPNILSADNSVLVIVDMQTRLAAAMPEKSSALMLASTGRLVESASVLNVPIIVTEQYPEKLGATDTSVVQKLSGAFQIFDKTGFSCCMAKGFNEALEMSRRKQIILAGQEAHVCVLQTALELLTLDYQVYVVEDALCSRKTEHKFYALQRMQQQGVTITNHESVLFEWLKSAAHPEFKKLSQLIR